jgi:hypothetical protein
LLVQVSIISQHGIDPLIPFRNCAVRSVDSCFQLLKETHLRRHT